MNNFNNPEEELKYRQTKKRVREIRNFYYNLACYCIIIPVLIVINLVFVPQFHWFYFSMTGWGIGLIFHAISAFGYNPIFGKNWEERKLKAFMEEEKNRRNNLNN
ncbi:MAG: 2TM domain-containing protein [Flavobacterium sp.]|nr:2TM domain-containing protein [Flavobacterium sp.]